MRYNKLQVPGLQSDVRMGLSVASMYTHATGNVSIYNIAKASSDRSVKNQFFNLGFNSVHEWGSPKQPESIDKKSLYHENLYAWFLLGSCNHVAQSGTNSS